MNVSAEVDFISPTPFDTMNPLSEERLKSEKANPDNEDDYSSGSSDDEDGEAPWSIHMMKGGGQEQSSIRRTDSWTSFLTRSQRNLELGKDKPPSKAEAAKRKVQFVSDSDLELVHEIEHVPDEHKPSLYMGNEDFDRLDKEVSLTKFRWENHKTGKIKFDENKNSIRGLESVLQYDEKRELKKWDHVRGVIGAINDQKRSGKKEIDWEQIRKKSLQTSSSCMEHAMKMGKADEQAHHKAWNEEVDETSEKKIVEDKKKKGGRGFLFWRKSSSASST